MKLIKKISTVVCAAAISATIMAAMPASAYYTEFCGGATLKTSQMPKGWGRRIFNVYGGRYGSCNCGEVWIITSCGTSYAQAKTAANDYYCYDGNGDSHWMSGHQARVLSGGKFSESEYMVWKSDAYSGRVKVINKKARIEGYYRYT